MKSFCFLLALCVSVLAAVRLERDAGVALAPRAAKPFISTAQWVLADGAKGACETVVAKNSDSVAVNKRIFANGSACGKKLIVTNPRTGKKVTVTVQDECAGASCGDVHALVMSRHSFRSISSDAALQAGIIAVQWRFA